MDYYLNHRWPQGPGVPPPPVPSLLTPPPQKPRRRVQRWVIAVTAVVLCLALVGGVCCWAVNGIIQTLEENRRPGYSHDDPRPWPSREASYDPEWSPDDLPWGDPDPSVSLSSHPAGPALSGRQAYQRSLPSLVSVEAGHPDNYWQSGGQSIGTGVIVTGSGYVLTNYHIIDEAVDVSVRLLIDQSLVYSAKVIGFDEQFDLAVLKFDPEGAELTPASLGDSDQLAVGDWVYAVGNPMGYLRGSMSVGIVSALGRDEDESGSPLGLIQISNPLNPGNSGGALVNEAGQVVGITCAKITGLVREEGEAIDDAMVLEGMGLAIPITDALPFVNHILATGRSWRPAIGIQCRAAQAEDRKGILVVEVTGDAPKEAGLREGDLILSANGSSVTSLVELRRVLYRTGAGGELTCTVLREGRELEISFPLTDSLEEG